MKLKKLKSHYEKRSTPITAIEYYQTEIIKSPGFDEYLDSQILPLIGQVVISFNALENGIDFNLTDVLNPENDELGWITIKHYSYSQKRRLLIEFLKAESKILNHLTKQDVEDLRLALELAGTMRNKIIHGDWEAMTPEHRIKTKVDLDDDSVSFQMTRYTYSDLEGDTDFIDAVSSLMWKLKKDDYGQSVEDFLTNKID